MWVSWQAEEESRECLKRAKEADARRQALIASGEICSPTYPIPPNYQTDAEASGLAAVVQGAAAPGSSAHEVSPAAPTPLTPEAQAIVDAAVAEYLAEERTAAVEALHAAREAEADALAADIVRSHAAASGRRSPL